MCVPDDAGEPVAEDTRCDATVCFLLRFGPQLNPRSLNTRDVGSRPAREATLTNRVIKASAYSPNAVGLSSKPIGERDSRSKVACNEIAGDTLNLSGVFVLVVARVQSIFVRPMTPRQ